MYDKSLAAKVRNDTAGAKRGGAAGADYVGESPAARALRGDVQRVAPLASTVLLCGETGVGKGLVARALHEASPRCKEPFVHADCASLAPSVIESELFGHERGAFTGAVGRHRGRLERAGRGTLFLDEIGELDLSLQARLLRAVQERVFERMGGSVALPLEARIVAATNRDLPREVREGRFRADLYFRLAVVPLELPPLRERLSDLDALVDAGLASVAARLGLRVPHLTESARACLRRYPWPGNVRELLNVLERLCIRCEGGIAGPEDVRGVLGPLLDLHAPAVWSLRDAPQDELSRIRQALQRSAGNVAAAARLLGMPRTTLRRRIAEYGLRRSPVSAALPAARPPRATGGARPA